MLHPRSAIQREVRPYCPMILDKEGFFYVHLLVRASPGELDSLQYLAIRVPDFDRPKIETAAAGETPKNGTDLHGMGAAFIDRECFGPFGSRRTTIAAAKIVSEVSDWREHHIGFALSADSRPENLL